MITPMLHSAKFEEMLDRRGRLVEWKEAMICSCTNMDSGQPAYSCPACHGKGYVYSAPITAKSAITSITLNRDWEAMSGVFDVGDAVMTVPKHMPVRNAVGIPTGVSTDNPVFEIGMNDKVTLLDDDFKTSEVLIMGMPMGSREPDTLLNELIARVKTVSTFDAITGAVTKYSLNADYVMEGNKVVWTTTGNKPAFNQQYSVVYFHKPMYVVIATLPKPRHQDGQDFPRYVALRYLSGAVDRQ